MIEMEMVRGETYAEPRADRIEMAASVGGAVAGALGGVAVSVACGLPYLVAAGAIGSMACSAVTAALVALVSGRAAGGPEN